MHSIRLGPSAASEPSYLCFRVLPNSGIQCETNCHLGAVCALSAWDTSAVFYFVFEYLLHIKNSLNYPCLKGRKWAAVSTGLQWISQCCRL